jgi:hypothetical protein
MVTVRPTRFSREVAGPVDLREALWFRRTVVWLVFWTLPVLLAGYTLIAEGPVYAAMGALGWPFLITEIAATVLSWLLIYALTGVHTYWFHPRHLPIERQNRAVALSYYACAPLALLAPGMLMLVAAAVCAAMFDGRRVAFRPLWGVVPLLLVLGWGLVVLLAVVGFLRTCLSIARHAGGRGMIVLAVMIAALPLIWAALLVLIMVLIPAAVVYAWGIVHSL